MIKGFDETYSQWVHINSSYIPQEVIWAVKFKKMYFDEPGKGIRLRLDKINDTQSITASQRSSNENEEDIAEESR